MHAFQNELIEDMAMLLLRSYKQEIIDSKYFAIMLDESTDASVQVLRNKPAFVSVMFPMI